MIELSEEESLHKDIERLKARLSRVEEDYRRAREDNRRLRDCEGDVTFLVARIRSGVDAFQELMKIGAAK